MSGIFTFATSLLLVLGVRAIEVTSNSPCYSTCGGGLTFSTDLTCNDSGYNNTDAGRKMDACLTCESTSTASLPSDGNDTAKNDLYWFLFNMKYTVETCLFNNISDTSGMPTCDESCNPLQTVLETSWFTTPMAPQYAYCSIDNGAFTANADACASCLQGIPGSVVLGNFLETMNAACSSQPNATLGQTLTLPVSLFDADVSSSGSSSSSPFSTASAPLSSSHPTSSVVASSASSSSSLSFATTATSQSTPSASSSSGALTSTASKAGFGISTGASIGIGVGIGVAGAAGIAALVTWCFLRRRGRSQNNLEGKADTRPTTYPPGHVSELPSKQRRFPEEIDGTPRPRPPIPPAELGTNQR